MSTQNGTVNITSTQGPGYLVRGLYFIFVGSWLGAIWMLIAWILNITIIGLPLGLAMLNQQVVAEPLADSSRSGEASYGLTESVMRNAEVVQAMGMLPAMLVDWRRLRLGGRRPIGMQRRVARRPASASAASREPRRESNPTEMTSKLDGSIVAL